MNSNKNTVKRTKKPTVKKTANIFNVPVLPLSGKTASKIKLDPEIFGIKPSPKAVAQAVRVFLSRRRNANAKSKTRSEVKGTRAKIWPQKGTGRARHSDRFAPIFVGGGVAHGPRGNQNFNLKLSKGLKRLALHSLLSDKFANDKIIIVADFKAELKKTGQAKKYFAVLLKKQKIDKGKICFTYDGAKIQTIKSLRGLKSLGKGLDFSIVNIKLLNILDIINCDVLMLNKSAVEYLQQNPKKNRRTAK
jgi:large subunit ribosomal protein L4